jgi:hypothetical protein
MQTRSCRHWYRGKAKIIACSECVFVVLGIRHAPYFHLKSVRLYNIFQHCLKEETIFGVKNIEYKFSVQILSEIYLILRKIQQDNIINVY